ncbi:hypothetical protein [Halobacterium sp. R2-5]|uniref:hypothetical protein n=1 Tax=Halobacterium sp. R2-5 TaxID=2715751 RepID=UPI0014238C31|nr:hypothetical protein [Halobacterium sp. R2-5]NIB98928.1 hypothetical protein [Halobacterium sp. R2-5]
MADPDAFSLHTKGGLDLQDLIVAPLFSLAAVVVTGIGTFTLFGHSLDQTLWSGFGVTISVAFIIALLVGSWSSRGPVTVEFVPAEGAVRECVEALAPRVSPDAELHADHTEVWRRESRDGAGRQRVSRLYQDSSPESEFAITAFPAR